MLAMAPSVSDDPGFPQDDKNNPTAPGHREGPAWDDRTCTASSTTPGSRAAAGPHVPAQCQVTCANPPEDEGGAASEAACRAFMALANLWRAGALYRVRLPLSRHGWRKEHLRRPRATDRGALPIRQSGNAPLVGRSKSSEADAKDLASLPKRRKRRQ